jgi:hypothetical protein
VNRTLSRGFGDRWFTVNRHPYKKSKFKSQKLFHYILSILKIIGLGKAGVEAIPRREEWESFIAQNKSRIAEFLEQNNALSLGYDFFNKIFDCS